MESLDHGAPQTTRAMSLKLGLHQSSVSHILKDLIDEDLVIKKGKGYLLSNVGIIQRNTKLWMRKTLRCLDENKDFILSHDLSGISAGFQVTMGVIYEGREIIGSYPAIPNHIQEIIVPMLSESRHLLVASSILVPENQLAAAQAVKEGGSLQAVTSDRIIRELRRKNHALGDESLRGRIDLYRHNKINLHLIVTETHLFLSLPRTDGTPDLQNIIISKQEEALQWGRMLYYYFRSSGELVDLATF